MTVGELPYMKLWVKELLADPVVQMLDLEEFGAYMRLLSFAWLHGGIPADERGRCRVLKVTPARQRSLWAAIGEKWEPSGEGLLVNPRQERERTEALASHQRRVEAGRRGGAAKAKRAA